MPNMLPDWYQNPDNPAELRWWNGVAWTDDLRPNSVKMVIDITQPPIVQKENVDSFRLAVERAWAMFNDAMIGVAAFYIYAIFLGRIVNSSGDQGYADAGSSTVNAIIAFTLTSSLIIFLYPLIMNYFWSDTLGKRSVGLTIVDASTGIPVAGNLSAVLGRNLLPAILLFPFYALFNALIVFSVWGLVNFVLVATPKIQKSIPDMLGGTRTHREEDMEEAEELWLAAKAAAQP